MTNALNRNNGNQMIITVQGYEVTLHFVNEPNTKVVSQIRQALIGTYLLKKQYFSSYIGRSVGYCGQQKAVYLDN